MKKCAIIYNPHSGRKVNFKYLPQFEKILNDYGYESKIYYTEYKGHASEIVKNLEFVDLVLSIGGDGTFNESVTGNYMRSKRLVCAHIPCGTTNDIGVMMGYGKNMIGNLKLTLEGVVKNVDICLINGKPFIYVAGIGKFTDIAYETPRELKKRLGYLAYLREGVKSFFDKTKLNEIIYEVDGVEYRGLFSFIIVSSANRISGINNFYRDVKLDDNKFEVLLCNICKKKDIIRSLYFLTMYDVHKVPGIYSYKTDKLKIKFVKKPKKPWCIDGEKLDKIVKDYEITIDRDIQMMIPRKNIDKLFVNK
ncbi:MAG: YegS/Rv2252/BmrU family lipid kinase [Mycoplasmatota bacterium]|nr:YegS/Rv2252/BmrU family lipid kinase [Mycoplasmatota bacterium]